MHRTTPATVGWVHGCGAQDPKIQLIWKERKKVVQSCLTHCKPLDYRVHGILQASILEWVAFLFYRGSSQPKDWTQVSHIEGGFFTSWATREAQLIWRPTIKYMQILTTWKIGAPNLHVVQRSTVFSSFNEKTWTLKNNTLNVTQIKSDKANKW